ncbi:hypothetical protein [Myxococcus sp. RHSTA-1-4]|uniref:hypothetical protein n=1 Tax=Myxococcus sp. RHSTA-1-4 TaxID=2874601 RepID=UPI001CBAE0BA|nr:hypothetical protein [Myxococcus sp. RHSTA-1-4]MBZ4418388.1 hypothetical protein [Myxococcus sp. RHSTA-1-4]
MRFNRFVVLPLAVLALGVMPACSGDDGDDDNNPDSGTSADAGTDAGTGGQQDSGTVVFPDAGTDPGTSPAGTCPANAIICETFDKGLNGWEPSTEHATIQAANGMLRVVTEDGHNEDTTFGTQAIARWARPMPAFQTQLWVRAHVYMDSLPKVFGQMGTFFVVWNLEDSDFGGIELQAISDRGFALDNWTGRGTGWNRQDLPINVGLNARRWMCLEWEIRRDTASSSLGIARAYVDGALAYEFTDVGMRGFKNFSVGYGFVHPKGQSGSETFYDNVVVSSTARIGCQ